MEEEQPNTSSVTESSDLQLEWVNEAHRTQLSLKELVEQAANDVLQNAEFPYIHDVTCDTSTDYTTVMDADGEEWYVPSNFLPKSYFGLKDDEPNGDDKGKTKKEKKEGDSSTEEGECSSSSEYEIEELLPSWIPSTSDSRSRRPKRKKRQPVENPPGIRALVMKTGTDDLTIGQLFFVTIDGAGIGRTADNHITLPVEGVSQKHAEIRFDRREFAFKIRDVGSRNGTYLNEKRLSEEKKESDWHFITHGDTLRVSVSTCLTLHIHKGDETCPDCEPGVVQALHGKQPQPEAVVDVAKQRVDIVKDLKKKYGLVGAQDSKEDENYTDRANTRRKREKEIEGVNKKLKVSSHKGRKTVASLNTPLDESNKGCKIMKKLGWKQGTGLGKTGDGIKEPIRIDK